MTLSFAVFNILLTIIYYFLSMSMALLAIVFNIKLFSLDQTML